MDELISQITQRTGISAEQARTAVETVVGFIKARLPEALASHVDNALNNEQVGGGISDIAGKLGGLFGGE